MFDLKTVAGGIAVAGSLGLAPLGIGAAVANAETPPPAPQVTSVQETGHGDVRAPGSAAQSPYAVYGGTSLCAAPGLYFVNICS